MYTPCVWENFAQRKPIADKVFCHCHICCVCSVSEIFSNHCIKLFWCLTVVVGLIKSYYIKIFVFFFFWGKIFVFLNLCLTEHWSIYLLVCAYCACAALFGFEILLAYIILYDIKPFCLLRFIAWPGIIRFCSVFVLCCSFSAIRWRSQRKCFICISW